MQQQSGKGSIESREYQLFGQSSDEFHGSRRNRMRQEIIAAVEEAGYGASVKGADAGAKKGRSNG